MSHLVSLVHLNYRSHSVYISQDRDTGSLHCFKYTDNRCDLAVFSNREYEQCSDYILTAFPLGSYRLALDSEE